MKNFKKCLLLAAMVAAAGMAGAQKETSAPEKFDMKGYKIYFGNPHSHCNYSGDILKFHPETFDPNNTPDNHFRLAKENGYDFYVITDHSQYTEQYTPEAWADLAAKSKEWTCPTFVALRGYEHSENNGPDGYGHLNVFNSRTFLNALADGVSLQYFYNWLCEPQNRDAFASFNHPGPNKKDFDNFNFLNDAIRDKITMFEISNWKPCYICYMTALEKGWRVAPTASLDNHNLEKIAPWTARTGVIADALTPQGVLDAMRSRRVYATFDKNLSVAYRVNGKWMGSALKKPGKLKFDIAVSDPDATDPGQAIKRIEIISSGDKVVASKDFASHDARWQISLSPMEKYYFLKIYNGSSEMPVAYAAPVWVE